MDETISRIRSGISGLKKENIEAKSRYEFMASQLSRAVEENSKDIKAMSQRMASVAEVLSAAEEKIKKGEAALKSSESRMAAQLAGESKHFDNIRDAMVEIGERIQSAQGSADDAARKAADARAQYASVLKYANDLHKRLGELESLKEKVIRLGTSADAMAKREGELEDLRGSVGSLKERLTAFEASAQGQSALMSTRISSDIESLKSGAKAQAFGSQKIESSVEKMALDMQSMKKDLAAGRAAVERAHALAAETRKRLEQVGTLESRIKHIEEVRSGLVKGVESLRSVTASLAAMEQKTKDLDQRLTGADRALGAMLSEKGAALDKRMQEKAAAVEAQMQERLRFLESTLADKGRAAETRLAEANKQSQIGMSARLAAMDKAMDRQAAGIKKLREEVSGLGALDKSIAVMGTGLEAIGKEVKAGASSAAALTAQQGKATLGLQALGKDMEMLGARLSSAEAGFVTLEARVASAEKAASQLKEIGKLDRSLQAAVKEAGSVKADVDALRGDLESAKSATSNAEALAGAKLDSLEASLKKEIAFGSASISRIDGELRKTSLERQAMRKDMQSWMKGMSGMQSDIAQLQKRSSDMEKLQIKLKEMSDAKDALSSAMEAQINEKIGFVEERLGQKAEAAEASLRQFVGSEKSGLEAGMASLRKDVAAGEKSIGILRDMSSDVAALEERVGKAEETAREAAKSAESLQGLRSSLSETAEKARGLEKGMGELRAALSREMSDARSKLEASRDEKRESFNSAVKAFLGYRAEAAGKMAELSARFTEMEKRLDALTRSLTRVDLLERKADRLTEKSAEIRRDVDTLGRKSGDEKVVFVDLEGEQK